MLVSSIFSFPPTSSTFNRQKYLNLLQLESKTEDNFIVVQMAQFLFDRLENIAGKGENAGNLFPLCFQMAFSLGISKVITT